MCTTLWQFDRWSPDVRIKIYYIYRPIYMFNCEQIINNLQTKATFWFYNQKSVLIEVAEAFSKTCLCAAHDETQVQMLHAYNHACNQLFVGIYNNPISSSHVMFHNKPVYFSVIPPPPTRKFVKLLKLFLRK